MKHLLLAGGGHAHIEVLRRFALDPDRRCAITLVNPTAHAPYSGMLPGLVAGHYRWSDIHIDLALLAARAGATLVESSIVAIDPSMNQAHCADGSSIDFDVCSLDVGSVPAMIVEGAREHAIGIKPVERFLARWSSLITNADAISDVVVVGGGAGGVEILLAMQQAMRSAIREPRTRFHLITDTARVLPTHSEGVRSIFERVLRERGVDVVTGTRVDAVDATHVRCADGRAVTADRVFWTTSASAPPWIASSGFAVDTRGFLRVDRTLRSISHPNVLGAGDAIAIDGLPLPKAGVFAVRQGPLLSQNLRALSRNEPLVEFDSSSTALNLISTGNRHAVMAWKGAAIEGAWVWRWKDWIDRRFMRRYR